MFQFKHFAAVVLTASATLSSFAALAVDKDALAIQLAHKFEVSKDLNQAVKQLDRAQLPVRITQLLPAQVAVTQDKALENTEAWLYLPEDRALNSDMSDLVVAYPPEGDEKSWTTIVGYNLAGDQVHLDVDQAPDFPVVVVEDHGYYAMQHNVREMNELLQASGLQSKSGSESSLSQVSKSAAGTGIDTTKLTKIELQDDQESWIKGAAEIYAIVSGVISRNDPQVVVVELPYLDYDKTVYTPNQIVVNWSQYQYSVVDMLIYESDDGTNYKGLVQALVTAIGAAGSLAGWPPSAAVAEIVNRIIGAMPDTMYTDTDDFVDACYSLEKHATVTDYTCAGNNATISLKPFHVDSN